MRITDVEVTDTPRGGRLAGTVTPDRGSHPAEVVEFVYRGIPANDLVAADALAAGVLVPCMTTGEDLYVDAPVSRRLLEGMAKIVDIYVSWGFARHRTRVIAEPVDRVPAGSEIAACFSGGVDSYFTALRPRDEPVTMLLNMPGLRFREHPLERDELVTEELHRAADAMGKRLVVVDTNVFWFGRARRLGRSRHWGSSIAAMAIGLGGRIRRCYIASSWSNRYLRPWSSHPAVDPLWSTESVEIVHDGAELERYEKARAIAAEEVVLDVLRVCSRVREYNENCRRCEKCQTTALSLHMAGTLERSRTLGPVTPATLRSTIITPTYRHIFELMREEVVEPELKRAITVALRLAQLRRWVRPLGVVLRKLGLRHGDPARSE